ncbi:DMT family transporter [Persicobacter psychrovividus]|uniref:Permease n=1 Tax=Persicobacter psychrovividus TaxID=387638 RepID=A0ABM7VAZ0_9BACT|nr:permease [Persicobacter psychrovividus]
MEHSNIKDYLLLHFIVFVWGFTAVLGKLITLPAVEIVFYRTLVASVTMLALLYYRKQLTPLLKREKLKLLGAGFLIGFHWILFFASSEVSTASVTLAGVSTCAFWTSLLDPLVNKRKVAWFEVGLGLIVLAGLYVIFSFEFNHFWGLIMAVGAAIAASFFTIFNGQFVGKHNASVITFYEMVGACVFTVLFFPFYALFFAEGGQLHLIGTPMDAVWLLILSLVCTVYAYTISVKVMRTVTPFMMNLTVNMEPIYGIALAVVILGDEEKMSPQFYLGTAMILFSVVCYPLIKSIRKRKEKRKAKKAVEVTLNS